MPPNATARNHRAPSYGLAAASLLRCSIVCATVSPIPYSTPLVTDLVRIGLASSAASYAATNLRASVVSDGFAVAAAREATDDACRQPASFDTEAVVDSLRKINDVHMR